jgi:hypothetical protein
MFLDMANSGLVVLGSSKYDNDPELNRDAFLGGSRKVLSYFKSIRDGLGIEPKNILDLFDSDDSPDHQQTAIQSFITSRRIDDLFVYIVGHGFTRNSDFYLFQKKSVRGNISTSMNISILLQFINDFGNFRTFAFIDACESGSIHIYDSVSQVMPVLIGYISSADATHMPRSGISILTSNNRSDIGIVLADDSLNDIKSPLFTHELLNLLRNGKRKDQKFGFSINYLREILEARIKDTLVKLNRSDLIDTSRPEVTDLTDFDTAAIAVLSDVGIFPNNDPSNALIIKAAKKVRLTYSHVKDLNEEIIELKQIIARLEIENENKDAIIITQKTENDDLSHKMNEQKALKVKALSQRTGLMYTSIVLFLAVILALAVSIAFIRPVSVDQLMQLIEKSRQ